MMANYYEKLTKIFLMSGNALYHAAAWNKYYSTVTSIGGKSEEDLGRLAAQVLVSALAVPVGLQIEEPDELKGKNARLTALLGLTRMPTRSGLLKDAVSFCLHRLTSIHSFNTRISSCHVMFSNSRLNLSSRCTTSWRSHLIP